MNKDDFKKMRLMDDGKGRSIFDQLIGQEIDIQGWGPIEVETQVMCLTHAGIVINGAYLISLAEAERYCRKKCIPQVLDGDKSDNEDE